MRGGGGAETTMTGCSRGRGLPDRGRSLACGGCRRGAPWRVGAVAADGVRRVRRTNDGDAGRSTTVTVNEVVVAPSAICVTRSTPTSGCSAPTTWRLYGGSPSRIWHSLRQIGLGREAPQGLRVNGGGRMTKKTGGGRMTKKTSEIKPRRLFTKSFIRNRDTWFVRRPGAISLVVDGKPGRSMEFSEAAEVGEYKKGSEAEGKSICTR